MNASIDPVKKNLLIPENYIKTVRSFSALLPYRLLRQAPMRLILFVFTFAIAMTMPKISIAQPESANSYFNEGLEKHLHGDLSSAIQLYSHAIDNNPTYAMAYQMRGAAQQQLKKYSQAIDDYSMAIAYGDSAFKAVGYYNRGVVKNMTGNFTEAISDFSQAIELDKKMAAAFFHRGIAKSKTGDLSGRMEDFRQAAKLGDINAETWLNTYYPEWKQSPFTAGPT